MITIVDESNAPDITIHYTVDP